MWQGRFQEKPAQSLKEFGESVSFDWRLYRHDIAGSIAHARGLLRAGILSESEFSAIEKGLREIQADIEQGKFQFTKDLEDVHMNIEAELTRRIGDAGAKLHTARSRNDQIATDIRLYLREQAIEVFHEISSLQKAFVALAKKYQDVIIPGYTHLQRAQPVPLAHHLLAYCEMLERDKERLQDALKRIRLCPLGSGAIAGSTIVLDRLAVARELGFEDVTHNSMDAVADRDFICEFLSVLAILGMHLSRIAEDTILWCSAEFGFLRLSDAYTTGSSLMPQKRNPDVAELVRGKSGRLVGNLVSLLVTTKGLPLTYNRDLQEDKEPLFDSLDTVHACLSIFAEMFACAEFSREATAEAASDPLLLATDLADLLVQKGVPFRRAHELVGKLVARAEQLHFPLNQLPLDEIEAIAPLAADGFAEIFDLSRALKARKAIGAPAPEQVAERIRWWEAHLTK